MTSPSPAGGRSLHRAAGDPARTPHRNPPIIDQVRPCGGTTTTHTVARTLAISRTAPTKHGGRHAARTPRRYPLDDRSPKPRRRRAVKATGYRQQRRQAEQEAAARREAEKAARVADAFHEGPLAATAQHIRLIQERRDKLANAMVDAQLQFLAALGREYRSGTATYTQLRDGYDLLSAAKIPGLQARWADAFDVTIERVRARAAQESVEADGSWRGSNPLTPGDTYPPAGQSVVYVLFDLNHVPVYVGSTHRFRTRMEQHRKTGKVWSYWLAHPCRDREHAYDVEARFLRQYMPPMNVQGPRR